MATTKGIAGRWGVAGLCAVLVAGVVPAAHADEPTAARAQASATEWSDALHSLTDAKKREAAIQKIHAALDSDDPAANHAAFLAISLTSDVVWDRAALRGKILAKVPSAKGAAQVAGFYALFAASPKPEDLDVLLTALKSPSPELLERGSHLLVVFSKGRIEGGVADAALGLLANEDERMRRETLRGLWGARVSPAVEARLLEIHRAAKGSARHDVVYFALSTLEGKSAAVVAALAATAEDPQESQRAVWGLTHGVAPEAAAAAADVLLPVFELRSPLRAEALRGLAAYGSKRHADRLEALVKDAPIDPALRQEVDRAVQAMRARP